MPKPKILLKKVAAKLGLIAAQTEARAVDEALAYIADYWETLKREHIEDSGTIIGLPNPYIVPASDKKARFTFEEQYYWDSYFIALGLVNTKHQKIAEGMLENLLHIYKRFHFIPNASRMYLMSRSQPPILTSFIRLIYETGKKDHQWLKDHMAVAEDEYRKVWMNDTHPLWHRVHKGLSRYYDINVLHDLAEAESGWDMTPRFERKCLDYLPIDLNSLLYKYEMDFAWGAQIYGTAKQVHAWQNSARKRKNEVDKLMWHKRKGMYFDYNYVKSQLGDVWSLAGYFPLWSGMASAEQAERLVRNIAKFEQTGGLTTTTRPLIDTSIFGSLKTQWAYPNGWSPLHWVVIEGLENYGYHDEAQRIAHKWIHTNLDWYERHGEFIEKYNVVNPRKHPVEGVYPSQSGFGWTNAVFTRLVEKYPFDQVSEQ